MKKQVTLSQIITGTLYYFDFVNSKTLGIIINDFLTKNPNCIYQLDEEKMNSLKDIIDYTRAKTSLKAEAKQDPYIYEKLEKHAGKEVVKYFKDFSMEEFMLRKLDRYNGYAKNIETTLFTSIELKTLASMKSKKYLTTEEENPYKVVLSNRGKAKLYMYNHYETIIRLEDELRKKGYNPEVVEDYLAQADLSKSKSSIFDIDKIKKYAEERSVTELKENNDELNFIELHIGQRSLFDEEGWKLLNRLVTINDNNHSVKIANPKYILEGTASTRDYHQRLIGVNWEGLKGHFPLLAVHPKHTISENLIINLTNEFYNSNNKPVYLAVVEEYNEENDTNYLIRGIIRKDTEGYAIAFNPTFEKTIPATIEEKISRLRGKSKSNAYMKRKSQN